MDERENAEAKRRQVQEQQKPIADWMLGIMEQKGLTPTGWARDAGLGRDTVSRAVKESYTHVTSTSTLIKLARAAKVPTPFHLLTVLENVPSAPVLAAVFRETLNRLVPDREWPEDLVLSLGRALRQTLLELMESPDSMNDLDRATMAARMSVRQQLHGDNGRKAQENE